MARGGQPLGGVDVFHLRGHSELRRRGLCNACTLFVRLGGRLDVAALEQTVARAYADHPELSWTLERPLLGPPRWRTGAPSPGLSLRQRSSDWQRDCEELAGEYIDGSHPWRLVLLRGPQRDTLALRWFHPLTDARGAARLLALLCGEPSSGPLWASSDSFLEGLDRQQRSDLARGYFRHIMRLARVPILSLSGPSPARLGTTRVRRLQLSAGETSDFYASLKRRAQRADSSILLWAGCRLVDRLLQQRGFSPPQQLVPLPVSLDRKGKSSRALGNNLTMMMLRLGREELRSEALAVQSLARQRREIIRGKLDRGMLAALDFASYLPEPWYGWASRRPFAGERSSLIVSNPGEIALDTLLGVAVDDMFYAPMTLAPPGFQLIASRHNGRLSVVLVFLDGVVEPASVEAQLPLLRRDLLATK